MNDQPQIPFSTEAEKYILGSLMIEPNLAEEFCNRLQTEDFFQSNHQSIFDAIYQVYRQGKDVDIVNVIEQLKMNQKYEAVGGNDYLLELVDSVPSYAGVESYVEILKQKAIERELYYTVKDIAKKIVDGKDEFKDLLAKTEQSIMAIVNKQQVTPFKKINIATEETFELIEKNQLKTDDTLIGLPTGFDELDQLTHGFKPGELIILAARPGIGKSAFALNVIAKMCELAGSHAAFFSLEMGIDQLVMRLLSTYSNVKLEKIIGGNMNDAEMARLLTARTTLDSFNLYLDESTTSGLEDIKVKCRKLKRENKLDFVVIDYLQLMSARNSRSRQEEVAVISRGLKLLARELEIPVLALSQLSRAVEKRSEDEGKKPVLSDLRESGSIEQDADIVLFLHREAKKKEEEVRYTNSKTELIIAKNRQGMTSSIDLIFRGDCSAFTPTKKERK